MNEAGKRLRQWVLSETGSAPEGPWSDHLDALILEVAAPRAATEAPLDVSAAVRKVLTDWGIHETANQSLHGWRCTYTDRYPEPCGHFDQLMADVTAALLSAGDKAEAPRELAGHRVEEAHSCFAMNCKDLGPEVLRLRNQVVAATLPREPLAAALKLWTGATIDRQPHAYYLAGADAILAALATLTKEPEK